MSIIDIRSIPDGQQIEADVCVIGSGAAGIALATEWLGRTSTVAILESGGVELNEKIQRLNEGNVVGLPYADLSKTWLRMLGGTTNHWTALVGPMEENVFAPRSWIPNGAWPISRTDLDPFYDRARRLLKLPEGAFEIEHWTRGDPQKRKPWQVESVDTKVLHWLKKSE